MLRPIKLPNQILLTQSPHIYRLTKPLIKWLESTAKSDFHIHYPGFGKKLKKMPTIDFVASIGMRMDLPNTTSTFEERERERERERDGSTCGCILTGFMCFRPRTQSPTPKLHYMCIHACK